MLDFYVIADDKVTPHDPHKELTYAGGLDIAVFERLQEKGVIDSRFDYYSDFRWSTPVLMQMQKRIEQKEMKPDIDVKALRLLLEIAGQNKSGLVAYAD